MLKQKIIPQLRFPVFKDEWETKPLIELSENGFSNGAFNDPRKVGKGYRIINVKDMYVDGTININNLTRVNIDEKEFSKNRVEYGDIFFTRSSLVKEGIAYSNVNLNNADDLTFDGHLIRMRPKKENSPVFLYYNFSTAKIREQFIKRGKTTTMTTIGQEDIGSVEILLPTLTEQKRIASFFNILDKKITEHKQKKKLLEQYKKGVMQKLFSQELRFKDDKGKEFPKWENRKLEELYNITSSKRVFQNEWTKTGVPFYRAREVVKLSETGYVENELFISQEMYNEYKSRYGVPRKDDLLITGVGTIGKLYVVEDDERFYFKDGNIIWLKTLNLVCSQFVKHLFKTRIIKKQIDDNASITTVGTYTIESAKKTIIPFPSKGEQTKIVNYLSAIEEKIKRTQMQIEKTELWKKGLLQKMFC